MAKQTRNLKPVKMIYVDDHDAMLVASAKEAMLQAIAKAHNPVAVAKKIASFGTKNRNVGRAAAIRRHPFKGICEASGLPLDRIHADLDELEPELGYAGKCRWVCRKANNSGKHSCGGC